MIIDKIKEHIANKRATDPDGFGANAHLADDDKQFMKVAIGAIAIYFIFKIVR